MVELQRNVLITDNYCDQGIAATIYYGNWTIQMSLFYSTADN